MRPRSPLVSILLVFLGVLGLSVHRTTELAAPASGRAVTVMLVIDTSLSVRGREFASVTRAATDLLDLLKDGDRAGLITFSDRIRVDARVTADVRLVRSHVGELAARGAGLLPRSVVWDAVFAGATVGADASPPPLVVLFSDGLDNASWLAQNDVAKTLAASGIVVDFVKAPSGWTIDRQEPGRQQPAEVAIATGGRVFSATQRDLSLAFKKRIAAARGGSLRR